VDPVPDPLLLRKNLVAPGIEPGPLDLQAGTLTTRPQRAVMLRTYKRQITGSGDRTLCELQAPLAPVVVPGKAPSQGYVANRQDSLAMVGNLSKRRKP
jgi:hypothetical protein